ncbi:MAG: RNA-directed DNA polymerase [Actinomycetota bacterium]
MSRRRVATGPALSRPIRWDVIPKAGGGERRLVVPSQADELAFARSVAGAAPVIRLALGSESHANRVVAWDPTRGPILEPWGRARRRWQREVRRLWSAARCVAVTDVRACYPSIAPGVMTDRLRALGAPEACVHEIGAWLRVFHDVGVDGLPVGPTASALLADAVLSVGDDAIRASGAAHVRWVDDVTIFAPDAPTRAAALEALRRVWAPLGLELHDGKTALLDEPAGEAHVGAASNSASPPPRCDNRST